MSGYKRETPTRLWTAQEEKLLAQLAGELRLREIAERLDRSVDAVKSHMYTRKLYGSKTWSAEEDAVLVGAPSSVTMRALATRLGRSWSAVYQRRRTLGLCSVIRGQWSKAEDAVILEAGPGAPARELMAKLGRSYESVYNRRRKLGVEPGTKRKWIAREIAQLKDEAGRFPLGVLADRLGRTKRAVEHKAIQLGLPMRGMYAEHKPCISLARRQRAPRPKMVVRVEVARVAYCPTCHAPVVNTFEGWAGHNQRMGCNRKARIA